MTSAQRSFLPGFCEADILLKLILLMFSMALVFTFIWLQEWTEFYGLLSYIAFFLLLVSVFSAATICLLQRQFGVLHHAWEAFMVVAVFSAFTMGVFTFFFAQNWLFDVFSIQRQDFWFYLLKFELINLICVVIALRFLYLQFQSRQQLLIQNQARLEALQARIRPHFLFNSMNTIASLVHDSPDQAEQCIVSLSDLFRASLGNDRLVKLSREIELTENYIKLEKLRLEDRLQVDWQNQLESMDIDLPPLILQPLVENAIYHGIEPLAHGGIVSIYLLQQDAKIMIKISNPLPKKKKMHRGHQMALINIRERLNIAFEAKAKLQVDEDNENFSVQIEIPR